MDREVLTPKQLQELLQIGRKQTYELIHSKQIPSIRIGKSIRIPRQGVDEFLGITKEEKTQWKKQEHQYPFKLI